MTLVEKLRNRGITPRACLYARFSSDNQREESIEAQLRAMHDFCDRNKIIVVREYCDRAKSATTDDRPRFQEMIADSKEKSFDFAIVHKLDRFARNRYDSAFYKRELKKNGVTLLSVLEQMDDSPESIILESVLEGMSEYYSKNLSREVMKGMRESAMQCRYTGGIVPYGFCVNKQTYHFEINPQEAAAIRTAFQMVSDGHGYGDVVTYLNEHGYRTRHGNLFNKNGLYEILRNEKYNGVFIFNRASSKTESGTRNNHKSKDPADVIRIPGGVPKIVDDEVFARVQRIMGGRVHSGKICKERYLLSGKIVCGLCGKMYNGGYCMSGARKTKRVFYKCRSCQAYGSFERCRNRDISRDYLESFVLNEIEKTVFDPSRIPNLIAAYQESSTILSDESTDQIRLLKQTLKTIEQKISNIVGVISNTGSPALSSALEKLEKEKLELERQIAVQKESRKDMQLDADAIQRAFLQAQQLFAARELPQIKQLINLYVDRIVVFPEHVEILLNNIPNNLLPPSVSEDVPMLGDIHIHWQPKTSDIGFLFLEKTRKSIDKKGVFTCSHIKESTVVFSNDSRKNGGAEGNRTPVRKQLDRTFSGRSLFFPFPRHGVNKHTPHLGSFMIHGTRKA